MSINSLRDEYRRAGGPPIQYTPMGAASVSRYGTLGATNNYYLIEEVSAMNTWLLNNPAPPIEPIKPLRYEKPWE